MVSGPGTATFGNAGALQTSAAFSSAGVYSLELKATDGSLSSTSTLSITVSAQAPTNQAPNLNAGVDQTITLPAQASVSGTASDDGLPSPPGALSAQWSMSSGPGAAIFSNPTQLSTTVSFSASGTYVLTLSVSDSLLSAQDSLTVVVNPVPPVNQRPVVAAGADQTVTLPSLAALVATASDDGLPSPSTLTYQWSKVSGPGTVSFSSGTSLSTQASFSASGTYVLQLSASDSALSGGDTLSVTVLPAPPTNQAPVVNAGQDQSIAITSQASLTAVASDDNLPNPPGAMSYQWTKVSGPGTVTFSAATSRASQASFSQSGAYVLQFSATDSLLSASDSMSVTVNQAPVVNAGADQAVTLPAQAALQATASDDGIPSPPGAMTYQWSMISGPGTVIFSNPTAKSSQASFSAAGSYVLQFTASDLILATSDSLSVTVSPAPPINQAPVVNAGVGQTITLPAQAQLLANASDDGLPNPPASMTYQWSMISGPGTVTFSSAAAKASQASFSASGSYVLQFRATDSLLAATDTVSITVNPVPPTNQAPVVNAGADQAIQLPAQAALQAGASDDGLPNPPGAMTYQWSMVSGPGTVTFSSATSKTSQATFSLAGNYVLQFRAADSLLATTDTLSVTVSAAPPSNQSPTVNAGPDASITLPATAALSGSASDDGLPNPPASLTYQWTKVSGPGVVTFSDSSILSPQATFSIAGTYVLRLTASDSVASSSDSLSVVVSAQSSMGSWDDRCVQLAATYSAPQVSSAPLRTLYIDAVNGNDANTGLSAAAAWKTLTKANSSSGVRAGDLVLLSGTFTDQNIQPANSGTAQNRIVFRSAPGQTAVVTISSSVKLTAINLAGSSSSPKSYIVIDGIDFNQQGSGDGLYTINAAHIWLRNLKINKGTNRISFTVDSRFDDVQFNQYPIFYMRDSVSRNIFARSTFNGGTLNLGNGVSTVTASLDNEFFGSTFFNPNDTSLSITGNANRTKILCNTIRDNGINKVGGGTANQPQAGGGPALVISVSDTVIQHNIFHGNKWEMIRIVGHGNCGTSPAVMNANFNLIQHNVFYSNGGPPLRLMNSAPGSCATGTTLYYADTKGNRIENNIFWKNSTFCDFHWCDVQRNIIYAVVIGLYHTGLNNWPSGATGMNGNLIRNNYMGRDQARINTIWMFWEAYQSSGARSYTLRGAETAFPGEIENNSEQDPLMTDPDNQDFVPLLNSPVIDFGRAIQGLIYNGTAPDAGRYEYRP